MKNWAYLVMLCLVGMVSPAWAECHSCGSCGGYRSRAPLSCDNLWNNYCSEVLVPRRSGCGCSVGCGVSHGCTVSHGSPCAMSMGCYPRSCCCCDAGGRWTRQCDTGCRWGFGLGMGMGCASGCESGCTSGCASVSDGEADSVPVPPVLQGEPTPAAPMPNPAEQVPNQKAPDKAAWRLFPYGPSR